MKVSDYLGQIYDIVRHNHMRGGYPFTLGKFQISEKKKNNKKTKKKKKKLGTTVYILSSVRKLLLLNILLKTRPFYYWLMCSNLMDEWLNVYMYIWGVQLRLAFLASGKGRGGMYLFLLLLSSPFLWETTQNDPQGLACR